ncbi:MAG: sulfatase [Chloroflexota bacterium]
MLRSMVVFLLFCGSIVAGLGLDVVARPRPEQPDGPNVILILLDDVDSASMQYLPEFQDLAADGATFTNFFVTTPICCPSRVSFMRGQYAHNHDVRTNFAPDGAFGRFYEQRLDRSTIANWLRAKKYRTAFSGKFLNGYVPPAGLKSQPSGWTDWSAIIRGHYYDFTLQVNGRRVAINTPNKNTTEALSDRAVGQINKSTSKREPFFLMIAPQAAHSPLEPDPEYAERFLDVTAPRDAAYTETDVRDKPDWVRQWPDLTAERQELIDENYRQRLRLLLSVDDMVRELRATLEREGIADSTYIILTSDNGWMAGAHRLEGKQSAYDPSARVPLIIVGPGIAPGTVIDELTANIDLAPTIADWTGAEAPAFVDGRSLVDLAVGDSVADWRDGLLIEFWRNTGTGDPEADSRLAPSASDHAYDPPLKSPDWDGDRPQVVGRPVDGTVYSISPEYLALRTADVLYVEYGTGEREFYDLQEDPAMRCNLLGNLNDDDCDGREAPSPAVVARHAERLAALASCAGESCREADQ